MTARAVAAALLVVFSGAATAATPAVGTGGSGDHGPRPAATADAQVSPPSDRPVGSGAPSPSAPAASSGRTTVGNDSAAADDPTLNVSYTYRRVADSPGVVDVRMRLPATPTVDRVRIAFPDEATVRETANVARNGSTYEWTGDESAELGYRLRIDWSYTGNARADWTLVEHLPPRIRTDGPVEPTETIALAGEGYLGNETILLGAHDVYRRQVDGQTVALVVPGNQSLRYGPRRTVDALADASRSLRIGGRDEVVHAFATPQIRTEAVQLEHDGFALDGTTILVDADAELAAWLHEYVHTRQAFSTAASLRWLSEASGRYYEWLLAVETGYAGWGPLQRVFRAGAADDSVLAEPDSWDSESDYTKGALVLAAVDRTIRTATDGDRTLADALRRINGPETTPNAETFVRAVREVGGPDAAATADRYVTTAAVPEYRPEAATLEATYGVAAPQVRERLVNTSATSATGTRRITDTDGRIPLGRNETLRFTVTVTNTGGAPGVGAVMPRLSTDRLGGEYVDTTWVGRVGPDERVTRTATHRFDSPGSYVVTWNGVQYDVRVAPARGTASVADVTVSDTGTDDGRAVLVLDATVRNDGRRATFAAFPVTRDGQRVSTAAVVVGGTDTRTVTVRVDAPDSNPTTIGVGAVTTSVPPSGTTSPTVTSRTPASSLDGDGEREERDVTREPTGPDPPAGSPGIDRPVIAALVALLAAVGIWRWRSRRH